jgi:ketosteroid isomerase-like protein
MSAKYLFVKRKTTLSQRLLLWGLPVFLLTLLISILQSPDTDSDINTWTSPVEPKGTVVVTSKNAAVKLPPAATAPAQTSGAMAPSSLQIFNTVPAPSQSPNAHEEVTLREALNQWQHAWSSKNVTAYLSLYGADFVPPSGMTRQSWESTRQQRISSKQKIAIVIQNLRLQINNNTATAKFTQIYTDERLRMTDQKTLVWQKLNGRWLIERETTD